MENETRIKIYPEMQEERLQELVRTAELNLDWDELDKLNFKLKKVKKQIHNDQFNKRPLRAITPNIITQKLLYCGNSSKFCYYLEYHEDDKSLFFSEIKDGNLKRIKIEYVSPKDKLEFYEYAQELIKRLECDKFYPLGLRCHIFFEESRIRQILLDNGLVNKLDNVIVAINSYLGNSQIGFAAIRTVEDDRPFNKIISFQKKIGPNKEPLLHVVECGELLSESYKARFENNQVIDYNWKIEGLLGKLNYDMYIALLFPNSLPFSNDNKKEKERPINKIFKPAEIKIGPDSSEIKPYDKYLEAKYRPFNIDNQTDNLDDDNAIKKHIERSMNIQNILKNIHMAGGPTNTLLRMPYRCVDGTEIKPNLPTNLVNTCVAMSRTSGSKTTNKIIKANLTKAIREFVNKSIDESLEKMQQE